MLTYLNTVISNNLLLNKTTALVKYYRGKLCYRSAKLAEHHLHLMSV